MAFLCVIQSRCGEDPGVFFYGEALKTQSQMRGFQPRGAVE
jgi:hypothetical protein